MNASSSTFSATHPRLTVSKFGLGAGNVASTPAGITCGRTCSARFPLNTIVSLSAIPAAGSAFAGWSDACAGTSATTSLTMTAAATCTAVFALIPVASAPPPLQFSLSIANSGTGTGIVSSNPVGIACGTTCAAKYASGTIVTLTAVADAGSSFGGWSGHCTGTAVTTQLNLAADANCTATFTLQTTSTITLFVTPSGSGSGIVTSNPAGISCGSACSMSVASGATISLTTSASAGSAFTGWSGSCSGTAGTTQVTLTASATCYANFTSTMRTVTPSADANGNIIPAVPQVVAQGATVAFAITPAAGYTASVGGTCGGTLTSGVYTTSPIVTDCSVAANFAPIAATGVAVTYYVATYGSDANSCATARVASSPRQTIQAALACVAAGDSLVVRDGTYAGAANTLANLPNGAAGKYITIMAENEGSAIVTAGLSLAHTNSYLIFQGLRFQDASGRNIVGNHLKFFRNEFKGGCANGNCANTTVGTNDFNDTADILFEDNWWHGEGGRYNVLVYNANRVVIRRGVIRHDGGWTDTKGDPEAGLAFYNAADCSAQNVIIVDSNLSYHTWQSAFYSVFNSASPNINANNSWLGIIALNNFSTTAPDGAGLRFDGNVAQANHFIQDAVLWDNYWGINVAYASSVSLAARGLTIGQTVRRSIGYGVAGGSAGTKTITNAIVTNMNNTDFAGVSATNFNTFNNGVTSAGTGRVTFNPLANGLLLPARIEFGSALKTAGEGGGQIGAQVVSRIGAAGSLRADTGWNADTGTPLWPFPNEARIKKEICTDVGVTRGFCSNASFTNYVMSYIGGINPY